jgi:hypothetical protein
MMTARPASFPVSADNAVRKLLPVGKRWKTYAESIPSAGYVGGDATGLDGGQFCTDTYPCQLGPTFRTVPSSHRTSCRSTQFAADLASNALPNYSFITPNGCNDAHDRGMGCGGQLIKSPRSNATDCSSLLLGRVPELARNRKNRFADDPFRRRRVAFDDPISME